jgi:hypothetical protein
MNCQIEAAKILTGFAKGLRNKFGPHAPSVVLVAFKKLKVRQEILKQSLIEMIDAVFISSVG